MSSGEKTAKTLLAGAFAGCCEAYITMPFEVTKNRIQLGHGPNSIAGNMADTVRRAGPRGLYYGIQAQVLQVSAKGAIRFTAVDRFKAVLPPGSSFTAGLLAGLTEALVWVAPTERLKVLRQAEVSGTRARLLSSQCYPYAQLLFGTAVCVDSLEAGPAPVGPLPSCARRQPSFRSRGRVACGWAVDRPPRVKRSPTARVSSCMTT